MDGLPSPSVEEHQGAPVPLWRVLLVPWVLAHRPRRAARRMAAGSRISFWVSFGLAVLCLAATLVGLMVWDATVERSWGETGRVIRERPFTEVWHDWHRRGGFGPAELTVSLVGVFVPLAAAFAAWLFLPTVHHGGSAWRSYRRAYRGVASGIGLLTILTLGIGAAIVGPMNLERRGVLSLDMYWGFVTIATLGAVCLQLFWLDRAVSGLGGAVAEPALPPRCEGCGYDLTHQSASGRCSECGLDLESSLSPDVRRPGCNWENVRNPASWTATTFTLVRTPRRFYETLKLREPARASRVFARWHTLTIGLGAAVWVFFIMIAFNAPGEFIYTVPCAAAFVVSLLGWGLHRTIGALVASWWIARGMLPDARWVKKVIAYETAYLWVFCLYNGLFITSFFTFGDWISRGLSPIVQLRPGGGVLEVAVLFFGSGALCLGWFWRYGVAARAIRWSNF